MTESLPDRPGSASVPSHERRKVTSYLASAKYMGTSHLSTVISQMLITWFNSLVMCCQGEMLWTRRKQPMLVWETPSLELILLWNRISQSYHFMTVPTLKYISWVVGLAGPWPKHFCLSAGLKDSVKADRGIYGMLSKKCRNERADHSFACKPCSLSEKMYITNIS